MKAAERYLRLMEEWDELACKQHCADNWVDTIADTLNKYLRECAQTGGVPTLLGLILTLAQVAPRERRPTMSNMTAQEAIAYLQNYPRDELHFPTFWCVMDMSIAALQASVPHVLSLSEARSLEPHTPAYAEYKLYGSIQGPFGLGEILPKPDAEWPQYGKTVRWWTAWPDEELRAATPWEEGAE